MYCVKTLKTNISSKGNSRYRKPESGKSVGTQKNSKKIKMARVQLMREERERVEPDYVVVYDYVVVGGGE